MIQFQIDDKTYTLNEEYGHMIFPGQWFIFFDPDNEVMDFFDSISGKQKIFHFNMQGKLDTQLDGTVTQMKMHPFEGQNLMRIKIEGTTKKDSRTD